MAVFKRLMAAAGAGTTAWWLWTALSVVFSDDPTKRIFDVMDFYDVLLVAELFLCGWTAAGRRLEPASVGASILLATAATKAHLITRLGHNFLMDHNLYPSWFYHGKHYVNAQYSLILFGLFFVVPFLVALIRRRTMDRIYTGFIVFVGIGTTAMFHLVLI